MRLRVHRAVYILLLCLLAVFMTTSVFLTNLVWVLLLANWVAEWNWRDKFAHFRSQYLLHAFIVLLAVHLLWLIGTANLPYALYDLQKKLPFFAIPLVLLTTPPPNRSEALKIGICYVGTTLVVTLIGLSRHLALPDLPHREIVPHISHIRFGLNLCLSLVLLVWVAAKQRRPWITLVNLLLCLWFLAFLLLIQSYTSFVILLVLSVVLLAAYRGRLSRHQRTAATAGVCAVLCLVVGLCSHYAYQYYHLRPLSTAPLQHFTPNGNPYLHLDDGEIENGNYIHHYICEPEMRRQWAKLSSHPFDSSVNGQWTVYPTLLRYLNALGTTKDSLGMTHLTPSDVSAIEKGIANPVYLQPGPRKMVYALCYEIESYRCHRRVRDFSMLQRIELWRNAWEVFRHHPLLGVGTGDVVDTCQQQLAASHSPLDGRGLHTHSQYLNFLLAFGLVGFGLILFFFVRAVVCSASCRRVLFTAFLCIVLVSFVSEDTLETLAGIVFTAFGLALFSRRPTS